jgi:cephalosporin hydroxylase
MLTKRSYTIDIVDMVNPKVKEHNRIFTKGWEDYDLELTKGFETILIIEDAPTFIFKDLIGILNKFHQIVSVGSYFIIEDGITNEPGLENNMKEGSLSSSRILPNHPEYKVDRNGVICLVKNATFNVNGYLKDDLKVL